MRGQLRVTLLLTSSDGAVQVVDLHVLPVVLVFNGNVTHHFTQLIGSLGGQLSQRVIRTQPATAWRHLATGIQRF